MAASVASGEQDEQDVCTNYIVEVDELQNHNINASDIDRLKKAGLHTIESVLSSTKKDLNKIKGFSDTKVDKITEAARKCVTGTELHQKRRICFRISTGSRQWDKMLKGGFESGSITEVYGEFRCGKTQLSHTLAVRAQLSTECGKPGGKVAIIDTENTFRPDRIREIAERYEIDPDQCLDNITYIRAKNSEHQHDSLLQLSGYLVSGDYRLLIVDSIMHLFRSDFIGRGELNDRQQKLGVHLRKLAQFAEEFNIAVFMTNQVQSDPGASALFAAADGRKPVGGHILAHASTTRILLRKGRGEERVAKIMDSPDCAEGEATYVITTGGINDVDRA